MGLRHRTLGRLFVVLAFAGLALLAQGPLAPLHATGASHSDAAADDDELFVAHSFNNSISVYDRTASGQVSPKRILAGPATGLSGPSSMAVDLAHDELFVANPAARSVTVYSRTAAGNALPSRVLAGPATGLNNGPLALAIDPLNDELLVTSLGPSSPYSFIVLAYRRAASGNEPPKRVITSPPMSFSFPTVVAADPAHEELIVLNNNN